MKSEIGLIGLATMGANLTRNIANKGYKISVFNRSSEKTEDLLNIDNNPNINPTYSLNEFVTSIKTPRKIILMVKAGEPVDNVIKNILPLLEKNDIIIDCGNSNYQDTERRVLELKTQQIRFIGSGVSGGEEGALKGPSLMPGGDHEAWLEISKIFKSIAAKDFSGKPCVTHISTGGSGHFVKTVHNGIEYAIMELIAESYDLLRKGLDKTPIEISNFFIGINRGLLKSYLLDITPTVLEKMDGKEYLIDLILDSAGQKGTGRWTAIEALKSGVDATTINSAVAARVNSSRKGERIRLSRIYKSFGNFEVSKELEKKLGKALLGAILVSYIQGYELIEKTAKDHNWEINLSEISRIWQGGCIIRSEILRLFQDSLKSKKPSTSLLEVNNLKEIVLDSYDDLKSVVAEGIKANIALPVFSSAVSYLQSMTAEKSPANIIQGLRDYFGAHTYKRLDQDGTFHTTWE